LPEARYIGIVHFEETSECSPTIGSGYTSSVLINLLIEKIFVSPKPGRSRAQTYPANELSTGHDHSNQLEIPDIVLTLLWFL
jgi:hypothetical protein